jgi:hypothetical protein
VGKNKNLERVLQEGRAPDWARERYAWVGILENKITRLEKHLKERQELINSLRKNMYDIRDQKRNEIDDETKQMIHQMGQINKDRPFTVHPKCPFWVMSYDFCWLDNFIEGMLSTTQCNIDNCEECITEIVSRLI